MAPSVSNGNKNHDLWIKQPDGTITDVTPGKSLVPKEMTGGKYSITSVEIVPEPTPNVPATEDVTVVNVGQETLVFICTTDDDENFILTSTKKKVLSDVAYVIYSIHISS